MDTPGQPDCPRPGPGNLRPCCGHSQSHGTGGNRGSYEQPGCGRGRADDGYRRPTGYRAYIRMEEIMDIRYYTALPPGLQQPVCLLAACCRAHDNSSLSYPLPPEEGVLRHYLAFGSPQKLGRGPGCDLLG